MSDVIKQVIDTQSKAAEIIEDAKNEANKILQLAGEEMMKEDNKHLETTEKDISELKKKIVKEGEELSKPIKHQSKKEIDDLLSLVSIKTPEALNLIKREVIG